MAMPILIIILSTALMAAGGWIVAYRLGYKHGYDNGVWDAYYRGRARK